MADGDGQPNTVLFCMTIRCEKMDLNKPMLLEDPFGKDVSFRIRLMGIPLEYTNMELQKEIEEKYAGQDYLVDGEEAAGLFCSDILTDEEWNFDITFDQDNQFMELVTQPVSAQAKVWRYADQNDKFNITKYFSATEGPIHQPINNEGIDIGVLFEAGKKDYLSQTNLTVEVRKKHVSFAVGAMT